MRSVQRDRRGPKGTKVIPDYQVPMGKTGRKVSRANKGRPDRREIRVTRGCQVQTGKMASPALKATRGPQGLRAKQGQWDRLARQV